MTEVVDVQAVQSYCQALSFLWLSIMLSNTYFFVNYFSNYK